ncbi:MAG: VWA domain-containing protein [Anaerolineales bacterium]|nr:VWA domain-containing protein [Anaerolineales bacterium]
MTLRMSRSLVLLSLGAFAFSPLAAKPGAAAQAEDDLIVHVTQIDRSQFPAVQVFVSATDASGEPMPIAPERLQLFENGEAVRLESVSGQGEIGPLTTLLVIDVSGSMAVAGKLKAAQAAAHAYVDQMRAGDQAGILAFNVESDLVQPVTQNRAALHQTIDGLETQDDTAMYDALLEGIELLGSIQGRKAIIALTDGMDNSSQASQDAVIGQVREGELSISSIGLGDRSQLGVSFAGLDDESLRLLAENAGGAFGLAADQASLTALYQQLGRALQSEYRMSYTTQAPLRDGLNRILTVRLSDSDVSAEAAYNPGGVLPEVAAFPSWALFGASLGVLLALMLLPGLLRAGSRLLHRTEPAPAKKAAKGSRVRLRDEPPPAAPRKVKLR